jgi:hypothetical protein
VFSNCRPDCIESQLRQGSHSGMDDNTEIGKDQSDTMSADQAQKFKRRWTTYYG